MKFSNLEVPNVFSCDVEDWYQAYNHTDTISEHCYANTSRCLEILAKYGVKGTFFVQGLVAEQRPEVVRIIQQSGHDIQTHGYSHRLTRVLGPKGFKVDLLRSIKLIEDITGKRVIGYRAPCFSIDKDTFWAFDVMAECGVEFDSSVFPLKTRRYGLQFKTGYSLIYAVDNNSTIEELPVSVLGEGLFRLPVGGGGYIRFLPKRAIRHAFKKINAQKKPFVLYCHPYEFDPEDFSKMNESVPLYRKLHQSAFRASVPEKLSILFNMGKFGTMTEALNYCRNHNGASQ